MFKTILVHVDGGPCQESRLRAAALLAGAHGAHLVGSAATGLSMASFAVLNGSMAMPVSNREFQDLRDSVTVVLDDFVAQAEHLGIHGAETRMVEDADRDGLLLQARYADLVVVSQDLSRVHGRRATTERGLPQYLALHGARPVLVVPDTYHGKPIPGDALVGWDGSMPAQRAINAALPLLAQAGTVHLALVNPDLQSGLHGDEPGADMAHYLARHGLKVDVAVAHTRATEGEALIDMARDCHAGLMVTGAFGHSRYREWILGGVTRDVLDHAPTPLLIAH
ncbi:universal stress protein [Massilia sp. CFBP9012]|uniref:universal stress protein n=1 Tax=Massilia sp. CFBP9012 TaxID=3096531 RepID=UPI002A69EF5B|nr:universal stress protein [Massilia sp. CFBP9012]MDY0973791.1 universal stress protein [Massilia sp. CFBP9012]